MLTSVSVVAPIGASFSDLVMPVLNASPDEPIFVREITGIEPVTANVITKDYNLLDGEFPVNTRLPKRNIVLTLGLNNVDVALPLVYSYMMTKSNVTLKFEVDGYPYKSVYIDGIVEATPFNHFSQDPEIQISIICPKPNFKSAVFVVEGTSDDDPADTEIEYQGNMIAGFKLELEMGSTSGINGDLFVELASLALGLGYRNFKLVDAIIPVNETFLLNTNQGEKTVEKTPVAPESANGLLYLMDQTVSQWLTLWPGTNEFRVRTPSSALSRDWTLTYTEQFGGI